MNHAIIREIQQKDNAAVGKLIRGVFIELNIPKVGTAYADPQLDYMFETYNNPKSAYFVTEINGKIVGGAGVAQLENAAENICELQKMYFLNDARGLGLGAKMIGTCLQKAADFGYEKCYLETMPNMESAQKLYLKNGFQYIEKPMGNTGHNSCPVWMLKTL